MTVQDNGHSAQTELVRPRGVLTSGGYAYPAEERQWVPEVLDRCEEAFPWIELHVPGDWNRRRMSVAVQRQGLDLAGAWGVEGELSALDGALSPEGARLWAHALLAAADLAEDLEQAEQETPC